MAARDRPAIVPAYLPESLPLTEDIAIALAVIGSGTGAEEIGFHVSAQFGVAELAFGQQAQTRLAATEVELGNFGNVGGVERNTGERRVVIGAGCVCAIDSFR